jgi:4-hydroxyphenylpyruvate dioxygenase-like putative hemolysin
MTYYEQGYVFRKKECANKYVELKNHITSKDKNGKLNKWFLAYEHIIDLEKQLEQQKKQIEEYRVFFSLMRNLLPRESSISDVIN